MRALRLIVVLLIVFPFFILALSEPRIAGRGQPFAQITAAPGPVPLTPPVAPGQPAPFSTIGALPSLVPAPGSTFAQLPTALPTPRTFRCTCSAPGVWTYWVGLVSSSNYILARQSARGQCAQYLLNANAPSPFITMNGTNINQQRQTIYNGTAFTQRQQVQTSVGQSGLRQRSSVVPLTTECSQCACN